MSTPGGLERFEIDLGDKTKIVFAEWVGDSLWIHVDGKNLAFPKRKKSTVRRGKGSAAAASLELSSPMPGRILKILRSKGDIVEAGEAIVLMEAMKMEYSLKASLKCRVSLVSCTAGEQVKLGQRLVTFEALD